jgi:hypothetical protein
MAEVTMAYLPPPPLTTTATLVLIALALPLPWTRIGRWGGGPAVTRLICRCQGHCYWRHLFLHWRDHSVKDDSRGDRQGRHANIHGREEVRHHDPIGMELQKQKQKQKQNKINNSGGNVTVSAPADSYACAATAAASAEAE